MSIRIRRKPIKEAVKDLEYVDYYLSEWKNNENALPSGTHQQRYTIISTLVGFALTKLAEEMERSSGSNTVSNDSEQSEDADSGDKEATSNKDS
tara:strand:+ start:229 stop:510 length:282 start_codon:yes stop_codon:yes gene_type:complete